MTMLSAHTSRAIHNKGRAALYSIAAEYDCDFDDVVALLGTTSHTSIPSAHNPFTRLESTTQSQPEVSSSLHAPAAQTDGEAPPASPSVAPIIEPQPSAEAVQASGTSQGGNLSPRGGLSNSLPGAECAEDRAPIPEAPKPLPNDEIMRRPAEAKTSEQGTLSSEPGGVQDRCESTPPTPSRPRKDTARANILAIHAEHPDWPSKLIAQHLGISEDAVRATASRKGIKLVSWWDYERALKAETRQALAASVAKPPEAEAPTVEPQVQPAPELPPLSKPSERLRPLVENDVSDVLHRPRKAQSGRFYLREKAVIGQPPRWVHQSLSPCPTGPGPLMTLDRKWAWFDTMDRYRGALKQWPQITSMIKEAVQ